MKKFISILVCVAMLMAMASTAFAAGIKLDPDQNGAIGDTGSAGSKLPAGSENDTSDSVAGGNTSDSVAGDTADKPAGGNTSDIPAGGGNNDAETPDTPAGGDNADKPAGGDNVDTPTEPETPVEPEKPEEPVQEALVITVGDRTFTADGGKWLYNTEFTKADTAKYKMIVLDKSFTGTFETNEYGAAIVLNKYGELVKIYDGANIGFWTVEGKAATTTITKANFASLAFSELEEGEMMIIFPNDGVNAADSARSFALGLRNAGKDMPSECGKLCTLTGFTFENKPVEPETPVEPEQPDTPAEPETPVEPEKPDEPIAPTGDYTFVVFAMMVLSMTAIVVLVSKKRAF